MLPVCRKRISCDNIQRIYATGPKQADIAWILCFNNIILQTLRSDNTPNIDEPDEDRVAQRENLEKELLQPLLVNYLRGLKKINQLLEPKLVNVQALLSMVGDPSSLLTETKILILFPL